LIRPRQADILILLKAENLKQHGNFLRAGGWAVSNAAEDLDADFPELVKTIDADTLAQDIENPKAVNLIVLGFALATAERAAADDKQLFCSVEDIKSVLKNRFGKNQKMLDASLKALETGYEA
jgi:indolepyruvate ferredoxin oxidoreductase beta subunit